VKYLSIRGETELALMRAYFELDDDAQGKLPETREFLIDETLATVADKWKAAADAEIQVPPMPADIDLVASIAKGKELFYGDKANCVKCHGVTGLGDGQANDYDDWNKAIVEINKGLDRFRELFARYEADEQFSEDGLVKRLEEMRESVRQRYDVGRTLDEQLADAVLAENYELAAKLRDRMQTAPTPASRPSAG
jgi:cytochrome c5